MRIAYVCADPGVPVFGTKGASVHVQGVLGALSRAGAAIDLYAARTGGEPPGTLRGITCHGLGRPSTQDPAARERALAAADALLATRLVADGPFDLVYERHALFASAAMRAARELGVPGVLEVNAPLVEEQATHRTLVDREGAEAARRRAFGAATAILAVSSALAEELERHPEARGKVRVVPNAVDPARFPAPPPAGDDGRFTVAFVGTLKPWHGLETLVDAFTLLREDVADARLLVIGDGPGRRDLEARLERAGAADATILTGALTPACVGPVLAAADVAVAPYPPTAEQYFSPLKVFEGMAAGLPVVCSRTGQPAELVRDGETGLLCTPGDPAELARVLAELAADAPRRRRIGAAARAWVLREHTWDRVAERILALTARRRAVAA